MQKVSYRLILQERTKNRYQERGLHNLRLWKIALPLLGAILILHLVAVTHTAYPTAHIRTCLDLLRYSDYSQLTAIPNENGILGGVQLADQLVPNQAVVLVPINNQYNQLQDLYIYSCTDQARQPQLNLLFKAQGLKQGAMSITRAHTLAISEIDPHSSHVTTATLPYRATINREYAWSQGTFIQVQFPGLYPTNSRFEAEALQEQADMGNNLPWSDPITTTVHMAQDLLHWPTESMTTQLQTETQTAAHILLVHKQPRIEVTVTLQRLIQQDNLGLWFVTQAQTNQITLDRYPLQSPIASPMRIHGAIPSGNATIKITLFDHTFTPMPLLSTPRFSRQRDGSYTGTVFFTNDTPNQPGLLLITSHATGGRARQDNLLLSNLLLN